MAINRRVYEIEYTVVGIGAFPLAVTSVTRTHLREGQKLAHIINDYGETREAKLTSFSEDSPETFYEEFAPLWRRAGWRITEFNGITRPC